MRPLTPGSSPASPSLARATGASIHSSEESSMSSYKLGLVVLALGIPLTLVAGCSSDSSSGAAGSGGTAGSGGGAPSAACAEAASEGVRVCVDAVNAAWESCYSENDAPCTSSDSNVRCGLVVPRNDAAGRLCRRRLLVSLSLDSLVARLQNSCASEANSIAWRAFGGPQGAVWSSTSDTEQGLSGRGSSRRRDHGQRIPERRGHLPDRRLVRRRDRRHRAEVARGHRRRADRSQLR